MTGFAYTVVASALHDAEARDRVVADVVEELQALGGRAATDDDRADPRTPHVVVVATGGTEQQVLDVVAGRRTHCAWEPAVLVTHPRHNSLPAAIEALARLRRDGVPGRIVPVDAAGEPSVTIADLAGLHRMHHLRVGLVGTPSEWLVASVPDATALAERWGIELVDVDIAEPLGHHRDVPAPEVREVAVAFTGGAEPNPEVMAAAAIHPTLTRTIEHHRLDAVAVRCFDVITELNTSGCVALARLNDTGVVAGCEGDVASTVAMLLARELLGVPAWIANPAHVDVDEQRILLAHCTVAPSLVDDLEIHTHFESGLGIGLRGSFRAGPVTLLRLGGERLERHWFADAEVVGTGASDDLCRTQVTVRVDGPVGHLLDDPLGNHLVMVYGHHADRLERWWRLAFPDPAA